MALTLLQIVKDEKKSKGRALERLTSHFKFWTSFSSKR